MQTREIKSRFWDKNGMVMLPDVILVDYLNKFRLFGSPDMPVKLGFDEVEELQFTGLLDKNGKEIHEGDLVKDNINGEVHKIIWDVSEARFEAIILGGTFDNMKRHIKDVCVMETIGNIYETPELLK